MGMDLAVAVSVTVGAGSLARHKRILLTELVGLQQLLHQSLQPPPDLSWNPPLFELELVGKQRELGRENWRPW